MQSGLKNALFVASINFQSIDWEIIWFSTAWQTFAITTQTFSSPYKLYVSLYYILDYLLCNFIQFHARVRQEGMSIPKMIFMCIRIKQVCMHACPSLYQCTLTTQHYIIYYNYQHLPKLHPLINMDDPWLESDTVITEA